MALDDAQFEEDSYDGAADRTWVTSFNSGGSSYATNIFWQPLQNVDDPYADVEQASQSVLEGANLFCVKKGKAPQFGICVSQEGFAKGQKVAAGVLSSAMSNVSSFVAVFKVDAGWWYVCVRNDIILSDGDMLFVNEEDAKAQLESMLAVPDWNKRIAPSEWGIEGSEQVDLDALLSQGAVVKLQKIGSLRGGKLIAVFAIVGVLGVWILFSLMDALLFAPPPPPKIKNIPVKAKMEVVKQKVVEVTPWESLPETANFADNCYNAVKNFISVMPPGWIMRDVFCDAKSAKTIWNQDFGRLGLIKQAIENSSEKFSSVSYGSNGKSVTVSDEYAKVLKVSNKPTMSEAEANFMINDFFQSLGIAVAVGKQTTTSASNTLYTMVTFNFLSEQNPKLWEKILTKFSGFFINNIVYNPESKIWKYEGAIYVL